MIETAMERIIRSPSQLSLTAQSRDIPLLSPLPLPLRPMPLQDTPILRFHGIRINRVQGL